MEFYILNNIDSLQTISKTKSSDFNFWILISLIEFLVIIYLVAKVKQSKDPMQNKIKSFKNEKTNMDDLMNNIHLSRDLYKKLIIKCHPDRFENSEKKEIAETISKQITDNKTDYKALLQLKEEAIDKLNLNFN